MLVNIKITRMITRISIICLFALICSCNKQPHREEIVTLIDKSSNTIEKGCLIDGKREGYWVVFDTNYTIQFDLQYKDNLPNGKVMHFKNGTILIEAEECNGIPNGNYRSYHKYPTVAVEGYESMGKKTGVWKIYSKKGVLNKIVLFDDDTIKKIHNGQGGCRLLVVPLPPASTDKQ